MTRFTFQRLVIAVTSILILTAQRLPAPVQELPPDVTSAASPTIAKPAKPAQKIQRALKKTEPKSEPTATPSRRGPFAGTWIGTMQTFPAGNQSTVITIDRNQTTMTVDWFGKHNSVKAQIDGNTIRGAFPPPAFQPETQKWALTPQPDGLTARVRFRCFMNDFSAVFHRAGSESSGAQTAR